MYSLIADRATEHAPNIGRVRTEQVTPQYDASRAEEAERDAND
jgi:hypothetical protein